MDMLFLDEAALGELAALNAGAPGARRLTPAHLADGRRVLNADLLGDSGPGATWAAYAAFLTRLPVIAVSPQDWPPPPA